MFDLKLLVILLKELADVDVPTQKEVPNWRLKQWADYYDTPADQRDRVRNVMYSRSLLELRVVPLRCHHLH